MKKYIIKYTDKEFNRITYHGNNYDMVLTPDETIRDFKIMFLKEVMDHGIDTRQRARYQAKNWFVNSDTLTTEVVEIDVDAEIQTLKA